MSGMTSRRAAGVAAVLAILLSAGTVATFTFAGKPHDDTDVTSVIGTPRVELMPQDSPEWLERHYFDKTGVERKTEISYRNGDVGVRIYRADGTIAKQTVTNKDLVNVASAEYAADGKQVVKGFALRADLSTAWVTKQVGADTETTMYWANGKLFGRQVRKANGEFSGTYYRNDGTHWLDQSGVIEVLYNVPVWRVRNEALFDDAGTIILSSRTYNAVDGTTLYSRFEATGAVVSQIRWRDYGFGRTLTEMDEGAPERVKVKGEVMHPAPGIAKQTVIWVPDEGRVEHIIDTLDDGTTRDRTIAQNEWPDIPDALDEYDEPQQADVIASWVYETHPLVQSHLLPTVTDR